MAYTLITASDAEDLVNQLNTFEQSLAGTGEVADYQIPLLNSQGVIDDSNGPDCGATGDFQTSRRALVTYFTDWAFVAQPVQTKMLRLADRQISDWMSWEDAAVFAGPSPLAA
jgi:hypothetical protein